MHMGVNFSSVLPVDILRHADYDELIKYNLNVNTDRRFVPGTTLVGPRSNQAAS